tara:strand:- start:69886 stop:70308 length:423 start_codon:yes stop_codon:yes gene_type:complete
MATNISRIEINAELDKVWAALTKPELVKQWQYGSELTTDWKIGSKISFKNEWESKVFEQYGTVLAFNPNKNLKYSLFFPRPDLEDKPENYFEMEYRLTPINSKTLLEIIQEDNRSGAKQEEVQGEENPILKSLKSLLETK